MRTDFGWNTVTLLVLYVLSFFLLWEWLRPIDQITDTDNLSFFIIFAGLSLLLYFFEVDWRISGLIKLLYVVIVLQTLYFSVPFIGEGEWVAAFLASVWESVILTVQQDWNNVSDLYRSLLFFILLWLSTYLLHYWLAVRKQLFLFYLFTIVYVTLLDTFSPYDGTNAIIRIILFGFLLMGLLTLQRVTDQERLHQSAGQYQKWLIPLALMVAFSSVIAYAAPKSEPIWPDPVPFLQSFAGGSGSGSGVNRLGYGEDDSSLGGPFVGDETKVFEVVTNDEQYWRIETKDLYTGKGWDQSQESDGSGAAFAVGEDIPLNISDIDEESEPVTASIEVDLTYNHLVYPYAPDQVLEADADRMVVDSISEKIVSYQGEEEVELEQYEWEFREPRYSLQAMRDTTGLGDYERTGDLQRYLQLPENLPDRVRELAVEITEGEDNWYDKASAVEDYFSRNGFVYDQFDVPVPSGDQDYVDQFLFETQRGYCDNFSTSMVVLLRSVDIPARWVKGYTQGEEITRNEDGLTRYEITNNNAHSWVEVFFPEVGWVPFEPTVGFSNNVSLNYDLDLDTETETPDTPEPQEQETPETPAPLEEDTPAGGGPAGDGSLFGNMWDGIKTFVSENRFISGLIGVAFILAGVIIYRLRFRWMPYVLIYYYKSKRGDDVYPDAYSALLKQLRRYGLKRSDNQTLRSYAKEIDEFFGSREMSRLTDEYERIIYRKDDPSAKWPEMRELWEDLIKRTTG
ncbi:DUF4129 domain-containing transglutaminase family protein [Jeotgalibacillus sp. R-1-5s-1]|uniref:DUF4129 domain-containing transglutaminase family protein n=1 Tax=Jeotgalibacillus sp. R-1-5s-1 TaxID=2555897 RepID=UPI00106C4DA1|nr:DUF4129 domain-containing transglutaminase family protein [Jeotgalibacillus sp. R-1-5s-1]TFD93565.1 DUF4129 domain-containing protein [Jeotgalibacillus sp. R-1-5s-1]